MFSADLSWSDQCAETVGQRRERRLHNREHGSSTQSFQSDESNSKSSFWSLPVRKKNTTSKSSSHNSASRKNSKLSLADRRQSKSHDNFHDAAEWTIPAELPPTQLPVLPVLPSIVSSDSNPPEPRSPRGSTTRSSVCTVQHVGTDGHYRQKRIVEEVQVHEVQHLSEDSYVSRTTTRSTEISYLPLDSALADEDQTSPSTRGRSEGSTSSSLYALDNDTASSAYQTPPDTGPRCNWQAPSDWDIASIRSYSNNRQSFESSFLCDADAAELSQFQRFIRRMESAGPKVILERLKDAPSPDVLATDPYAEEEIAVEKHLWCLTALQVQNMENSLVPNQGVGPLLGLPTMFRQPKRVLELYSNLAEVYQLSAIYPKSHISYLTVRKPLASLPLPSNIHPLTVPSAGLLPLPYATDSFNLIRCAALPSNLAATKIQPILRDLLRMLAPGGILELRLIDSTPENTKRSTLDYNKRNGIIGSSTKATDFAALFEDPADDPTSPEGQALQGELAALVARGLWKDSWGSLVDKGPTVGRDIIWWWDDPEIVRECWDYGTVFECGTMFAFKE
ncbi:hypothetical protein GTA08_BOTSDO03815 [Botryosphaeria dothidea]|uniref:Uncharacterized protein n=1 Tax=Botryosphaeria dothidea TaxID=55169 RepID=A0A8H4N9P0_9PEZI|nr:hypothetical protein GTA08_BOTSDO03815 [Botryosphaeria dothidea]